MSNEFSPALNLSITQGGLRRPKATTPKVRLSKAESETRLVEFRKAMDEALSGNDSLLRTLTDIRYTAECVVDAGGILGKSLPNASYGRRRKFSNPLFLTPSGLKEAYPEKDEDLFSVLQHVTDAVRQLGRGGDWSIRETLLFMETSNKRYLRWAAEVKGKEYTEVKRTLEELAEIYQRGGRAALRELYTREHVAKIITRLRSVGTSMHINDQGHAPLPGI